MREPPKLMRPMLGEDAAAYLRLFASQLDDVLAWIKEAVETVEKRAHEPMPEGKW